MDSPGDYEQTIFRFRINSERVNALRKQYDAFIEEDKKRKERNDYILGRLDKMRVASMALQVPCHVPCTSKAIRLLQPPESTQCNHDCALQRNLQPNIPLSMEIKTPPIIEKSDDNYILREISKRYILIPKTSPCTVNNNCRQIVERYGDADWTKKYEILEQLKKSEKENNEFSINGPKDTLHEGNMERDTLKNIKVIDKNDNKVVADVEYKIETDETLDVNKLGLYNLKRDVLHKENITNGNKKDSINENIKKHTRDHEENLQPIIHSDNKLKDKTPQDCEQALDLNTIKTLPQQSEVYGTHENGYCDANVNINKSNTEQNYDNVVENSQYTIDQELNEKNTQPMENNYIRETDTLHIEPTASGNNYYQESIASHISTDQIIDSSEKYLENKDPQTFINQPIEASDNYYQGHDESQLGVNQPIETTDIYYQENIDPHNIMHHPNETSDNLYQVNNEQHIMAANQQIETADTYYQENNEPHVMNHPNETLGNYYDDNNTSDNYYQENNVQQVTSQPNEPSDNYYQENNEQQVTSPPNEPSDNYYQENNEQQVTSQPNEPSDNYYQENNEQQVTNQPNGTSDNYYQENNEQQVTNQPNETSDNYYQDGNEHHQPIEPSDNYYQESNEPHNNVLENQPMETSPYYQESDQQIKTENGIALADNYYQEYSEVNKDVNEPTEINDSQLTAEYYNEPVDETNAVFDENIHQNIDTSQYQDYTTEQMQQNYEQPQYDNLENSNYINEQDQQIYDQTEYNQQDYEQDPIVEHITHDPEVVEDQRLANEA